jgi:O-antigen biosynthesis protein
MHSRTLKPRKNYPKHVEPAIVVPDPNTSYAYVLEMVGERKKVLDLGCASGYLASQLVRRECDVVGVDVNPVAAEEARKYCTSVVVADLDETMLPELFDGKVFDAVVFGDVLEHLHEPTRTLDEVRGLLSERGYVVASIPNVSHGAIRLALLSGRFDYQEIGILDDSNLRFFTAKTIDELFLAAGFRIDTVERVTLSLFADSDLVPTLDPRDFDERAVAEIRNDPDSETLQFVVKAYPLTNDQRLRTIAKRFLTANTELAATKRQIAHRENELQALRTALESQQAATETLREETRGTLAQLDGAHARVKELEAACRGLEIDTLAKQNAAIERTLAAQAEYARAVETVSALQSKVDAFDRLQAEVQARGDVDGAARESIAQLERDRSALHDELDAERARTAQLGNDLKVERVQGNVLRGQSKALQAAVEELRTEIAALTEGRIELEERVRSESDRQAWAAGELETERERSAALNSTVRSLRAENERRGDLRGELETQQRRGAELQAQSAALRSAIESLDTEVEGLSLELSRAQSLLRTERQESATVIARAELDAGELRADLVSESERRLTLHGELENERGRSAELKTQGMALRAAIESLDAEIGCASLALARSQGLLRSEREAVAGRILRTESDCDELLTEAAAAVDVLRGELDFERKTAGVRRGDDAANLAELQSQLEAIRKAALADKLVMREYADEFRKRAERLEKDFEGAIRQRDDLYLRVVDNDRVMRESAEYSGKLEADIARLEASLSQARVRGDMAEAELAGATARSEAAIGDVATQYEAAIAELTQRSDAAIADLMARSEASSNELSARASSLENDVAHQKAVLEHLRDAADRERARADGAAADLASLTVRHEILQGSLAEMDNLLVAQTEQLLAGTSSERQRLLTLIDTVQSSHFWRIKHWLARLRVRTFRSARDR